MNKREIIFLLIPCLFFLTAGITPFCFSFEPLPRMSQQEYDQLVAKVNHGDLTGDQMVNVLHTARNSGDRYAELQDDLIHKMHMIGVCMIVGLVTHLYVVFRVIYTRRNA